MEHLPLSVLLVVGAGCGAATLEGSVRVESITPPNPILMTNPAPPVQISAAEFHTAMAWLAADVASTRTTFASPRSATPRVILTAWDGAQGKDSLGSQLAREYSTWCQHDRHGPTDCLDLGTDSVGFEGKRRLALSIAIGSVIGGAANAIGDVMNPIKLEAMVVTALGTYLFLLCVPEPVTKGLAALMTISLYAYLGHDLWGIIRAYEQMRNDVDSATTFAEVRAAGERFGHSIGENATRILIMVATARLGSKMDASVRRLPGFAAPSSAVRFETPSVGGASLGGATATIGDVIPRAREVVMSAGRLSIAMVAMAAAGGQGGQGAEYTQHGQQRAAEARDGDSRRQVGDANRAIREGRKFRDSETGNIVHVSGDRVVITNRRGEIITQFKNPRANTLSRIESRKWVPIDE